MVLEIILLFERLNLTFLTSEKKAKNYRKNQSDVHRGNQSVREFIKNNDY